MNFNLQHIAQLRVQHQYIDSPLLQNPEDIVSYLGAMQAQDYDMCKFAIALRSTNMNDSVVEEAINNGRIIRSHILRPTWHLVSNQDYAWMLALSAPQLSRVSKSYNKEVELDETNLNKIMRIILKLLANGDHLTRDEIMIELNKKHINTESYRSAHIMFHAELNGLVVNGKRKGKQLTYALFEDRITNKSTISRDEALAKLASRYFTSHSPATLHDFSWWSGLNLGDCRKAISILGKKLNSFELNNLTYYFTQSDLKLEKLTNAIHILPAFDELLVSYSNRLPNLNETNLRDIITVNGIFKPFILHKSTVIGSWKRTIKPKHVEIQINPFESTSTKLTQSIQQRFKQYASFLNHKDVRFVS